MASELSFVRHFAGLTDPRVDRTKKHRLDDILVNALCAVDCGADSFEEIERFSEAKHDWFNRFLALPDGIPSHDTFNRVFAAPDRDQYSACFASWMASLCGPAGLRAVAIDGKALRSAPADTFSGCLHLVNARAVENRLFLGQVAVGERSHDIAALPELLRVLDLKGALVTTEVVGCQKEIVKQVREQEGDYITSLDATAKELASDVRGHRGVEINQPESGTEQGFHHD